MASVTTYTRDFFYFIKKQSEFIIKEDVKHNLMQIEKIIKIINNNDQILVGSSNLNWRKPKSLIDKEKLSKDELLMIEITGLLNKLSPKNFEKIKCEKYFFTGYTTAFRMLSLKYKTLMNKKMKTQPTLIKRLVSSVICFTSYLHQALS